MNNQPSGLTSPSVSTAAMMLVAATLLMGGCSKPAEVAPSAPPAAGTVAEAASTATSNVSDADVSEHVSTVLNQNDALKTFDIKVVTLKGDVRLIGVLDTQAQIDTALKIAREAEGSHTIHNELTIKK